MSERCKTCDRADCKNPKDIDRTRTHTEIADDFRAHLDCRAHAIDWRARALAAEAALEGAVEALLMVEPSGDFVIGGEWENGDGEPIGRVINERLREARRALEVSRGV